MDRRSLRQRWTPGDGGSLASLALLRPNDPVYYAAQKEHGALVELLVLAGPPLIPPSGTHTSLLLDLPLASNDEQTVPRLRVYQCVQILSSSLFWPCSSEFLPISTRRLFTQMVGQILKIALKCTVKYCAHQMLGMTLLKPSLWGHHS